MASKWLDETAQDDVNPPILRMLDGAFSPGAVHIIIREINRLVDQVLDRNHEPCGTYICQVADLSDQAEPKQPM